ncbi:hypothetical protein RchiOBHm_Chr5g0076841 [Rosa chinensis]|uniref:Uncharacterized protein n=1 Tax=Rosa chinensis TaxID=74649 RepID=A0A2P6QLT8_ROSCH|nr:hypothetical protein RchiOBHm_Chr5g0076841 [Rosa chinensis]
MGAHAWVSRPPFSIVTVHCFSILSYFSGVSSFTDGASLVEMRKVLPGVVSDFPFHVSDMLFGVF